MRAWIRSTIPAWPDSPAGVNKLDGQLMVVLVVDGVFEIAPKTALAA